MVRKFHFPLAPPATLRTISDHRLSHHPDESQRYSKLRLTHLSAIWESPKDNRQFLINSSVDVTTLGINKIHHQNEGNSGEWSDDRHPIISCHIIRANKVHTVLTCCHRLCCCHATLISVSATWWNSSPSLSSLGPAPHHHRFLMPPCSDDGIYVGGSTRIINKLTVREGMKEKRENWDTDTHSLEPDLRLTPMSWLTFTTVDGSGLLPDDCISCCCPDCDEEEGRLENDPLDRTFFNRWCLFLRFPVVEVEEVPDWEGERIRVDWVLHWISN